MTNFEAAVGTGLLAWGGCSFVVLESVVILPLAATFAGTLLIVDAIADAIAPCDS